MISNENQRIAQVYEFILFMMKGTPKNLIIVDGLADNCMKKWYLTNKMKFVIYHFSRWLLANPLAFQRPHVS